MTIELQNLGKRYNRHWIFRHLNYTFYPGTAYAITGANGSGKSTLLQVLAGAITLSEGSVVMTTDNRPPTTDSRRQTTDDGRQTTDDGRQTTDDGRRTTDHQQQNKNNNQSSVVRRPSSVVPVEQHYRHLSMAAPYLELIEEMTLTEFLQFHFQFKPRLPAYDIPAIIECIQLQTAANRQIRHYSSGMKQRVKLAQAIFSAVPIILLDEPLTNLDTQGIDLYNQLIENFCKDRLLIICSNSEPEIHFCKEYLKLDQPKK